MTRYFLITPADSVSAPRIIDEESLRILQVDPEKTGHRVYEIKKHQIGDGWCMLRVVLCPASPQIRWDIKEY